MALIRAFKGFRPRKDMVEKVASPPYDVINSEEARELAKGNPYSFLHVVKSEIDLPEDTDHYSDLVYQTAKENLHNMINQGIFVEDKEPSLYLYQQQMGDHKQIGLVACASIDDYEKDIIKKHELTRADKEQDRIKHVDTLNANTGPVFLTYPADPEIDNTVSRLITQEPEYHFQTDDSVYHTLWHISDPQVIDFFVSKFAHIPALYVADGHHRSASAYKVGQIRKAANPNHTGNEEYNFFLSVLFPGEQLKILDYNRVVKDLNGLTNEQFLQRVKEQFVVDEMPTGTQYKPNSKHTIGMYLAGSWYKLTPKEGTYQPNDPVKSLDVAILMDNLLSPVLGIGDPRKDKRIDFVGGIRGLKELEKRVNQGEAVAFAMYPTSVQDLIEIADSGAIMPPKSTWFEPKLKSGMVIHFLS
ncbi:MAG: DUF1015 family protein [Candidatus Cloacimonetes bacterium]|nr:DUF1015 family protein [Candidatus Cloacimonadota bacterium]